MLPDRAISRAITSLGFPKEPFFLVVVTAFVDLWGMAEKNPAAQALGRLAKGKPKTMSAAAIAARRLAGRASAVARAKKRKGIK